MHPICMRLNFCVEQMTSSVRTFLELDPADETLSSLLHALLNDTVAFGSMLQRASVTRIHNRFEGRTIAGLTHFSTNALMRESKILSQLHESLIEFLILVCDPPHVYNGILNFPGVRVTLRPSNRPPQSVTIPTNEEYHRIRGIREDHDAQGRTPDGRRGGAGPGRVRRTRQRRNVNEFNIPETQLVVTRRDLIISATVIFSEVPDFRVMSQRRRRFNPEAPNRSTTEFIYTSERV
jgi:hypothetical protein